MPTPTSPAIAAAEGSASAAPPVAAVSSGNARAREVANRSALTQQRLRELLSYDPDTGNFIGLVTRGKRSTGRIAGGPDPEGYIQIRIDYVTYRAHRLVWLYVYGRWPVGQIDHRNGVTSDNRLSNLREATPAQNSQNRKRCSTNTSGFTGVHWHARKRRWGARIGTKTLGYFRSAEEANAVRVAAKAAAHTFQPVERSA
jgi:hypothetical protein